MAETLTQFRQMMDNLKSTRSRNEKKKIIRDSYDSNATIELLCYESFDNIGLGKKSVVKSAESVFGELPDAPTVSEAVRQFDGGDEDDLVGLYGDLMWLSSKSGNDQLSSLEEILQEYTEPSVVTFAILNDEALGVSSSTVADAFDVKDSLPFYKSTTMLVSDATSRGLITKPTVGRPFRPMLAKSEGNTLPPEESQVAQPKIDGYRLILHKQDKFNAKAYTRNMKNVTKSLPELKEIQFPRGDWIIDCEVIADDGTYKTTSQRIGTKPDNIDRSHTMNFACFDLLMDDSEHIHDLSYGERYERLCAFTERLCALNGSVDDERVYSLPCHEDIAEAKAQATQNGFEGVIIKDNSAPYQFGKRSSHWVKHKHEDEQVDVRINRMEEGEGRLKGKMGKLYVESAEGIELGAVGTGFSDEERAEIWDNQNEWVGRTIEVSAEAYEEGLRFPRFERDRRDDGSPDSIEKIEELLEPA